MFEAHVLGAGDGFSARQWPASLVLEHRGELLAVDCPGRYRAALRSAAERSGRALRLEAIDHVVLTHLHADHAGGLEEVGFFKHFVQGRTLHVHASPEVCKRFWERLRPSMGTLLRDGELTRCACTDFFTLHPLPWGSPAAIGAFAVTTRRTVHHVPTSALLVRAGGRSLGISSDTAFDPGLLEFLAPSDCILHEAGEGTGHTDPTHLAALPPSVRARMRLFHVPDHLDLRLTGITALGAGEVLRV